MNYFMDCLWLSVLTKYDGSLKNTIFNESRNA